MTSGSPPGWLTAYDRMLGLELEHLSVGGCTTKAPRGGQTAGPSPVDRPQAGAQALGGHRRGRHPAGCSAGPSQPPRRWAAGGDVGHHHRGGRAARAASGAPGRRLRLPALPTGPGRTRDRRPDRHAGHPGTMQAGRRWVIERTHAWGDQYGKLRWCTGRRRLVVEFWLALACASSSAAGSSAAPGPTTAGKAVLAAAPDASWRRPLVPPAPRTQVLAWSGTPPARSSGSSRSRQPRGGRCPSASSPLEHN
jgi:hypothetical protein